jgi:hypothetical protein
MKHLDDATLTMLRDRETADPESQAHLAACGHCASALQEAERREALVGWALAALDEPARDEFTDLDTAKARVRASLDARSRQAAGSRAWWWPRHMGRAAAILLVGAGAVSALPGSPVRHWLTSPDPTDPGAAADLGRADVQESVPAGIEVAVPSTGILISIQALGSIGDVEVIWGAPPSARVDAPAGSRFSYAEGRLEALVAGGPVRVFMPRTGAPATLEVDGRPYLVRSGERIDVTGPVGERTDDRIRFVAP